MSILNRTSSGQHSVLVVICKYLMHRKNASRDEIVDTCAPQTLADQKHVRQTLTTWKNLGLFKEDGGNCSFSEDLPPEIRDPTRGLAALPRVAREVVLRKENNLLFWESEKSLAADFTRAVSWALAQDVYTMPSGPHQEVEALERRQVKDATKRIFQNDTRWPGLKAWAPFLGFGWTSKLGFITDPTVAIRESLGAVFRGDRELPVSEFLQRLTDHLPVLDGGTYRLEIEASLEPDCWQGPRANEISTSLSRALHRLHLEKSITFPEPHGDAAKRVLIGRNRPIRTISHVIAGEVG